MSKQVRPRTYGRWLRRYSLTLVAALGGATGVAYSAGWHSRPVASVHAPERQHTRDNVQDVVQIALVLDTSSSMDGLINQARSHLWKMVDQIGRMTRVVDGKTRGVRIELALFEYGNDTLAAEHGHIRRVLPFTTDLDTVSEKLHGLFTNGGSEFVGQAIETAVTSLQWSSDPDAMKFVFVAGNEEFDQGPVTAAAAMTAAAAKDINVQLILCEANDPTWAAAAKLAKSDLMTIDQNHVATHIPSPHDAEILRLGSELNSTYLAYGADGAASMARQAAADVSSANLSPKVALERAQLKSSASYDNGNWDVVDAVRVNAKFLETATHENMPAELRGKSLADKQAFVAKKAAERADLQARIAKLEAERTQFLDAERAKSNAAQASSLETELMKSTQQVAGKKGYTFDVPR